ncbi:hypothetical protein P7B02_13310 [Caulobacter segnis]|uniref:hypothetical protein n=1 Tax=Caulobacter segnis TaxID=88688 RepID=UPI00240F6E47|nr:hypothetical protein [Caulobacter segnis]MDG2522523.1 hypothetical protein [Caulobacter segnis]
MSAIECTLRKLEARTDALVAGSLERDRINAEIASLRGSLQDDHSLAERVMAFRRHTHRHRTVRQGARRQDA